MRIGQSVQFARSRPDQRQAAFRTVEAFQDGLQILGDTLALLHIGAFTGQLLFFAGLRIEFCQLGNSMFQPFPVTCRIFKCLARDIKPRLGLLPGGIVTGDQRSIAPPETIEQKPMPARIKHSTIIMLPVNFHQSRAHIT